MADFSTRYKVYPYRYQYTKPLKGSFTNRDGYREANTALYGRSQRALPQVHDCREPIVKGLQDDQKWDSFMLAQGLAATRESLKDFSNKPDHGIDEKIPDKLLFHVGNAKNKTGSEESEFSWPRGLTVSQSGVILVADTKNHRIQTFNAFGIYIKSFGKFGDKEGEFNEPSGVSVAINGEIFVADTKNRRIQVFKKDKSFKYCYATTDEPVSIATDNYFNTVIATSKRTIEIYRTGGNIANRFKTFPIREIKEDSRLQVVVNRTMDTLVVCDPADRVIKTFNYSGDLLSMFEPVGGQDGLACVPTGIHILLNGHICVCDNLNHCVNLYDEQGRYLRQIIGPSDKCGSIQQCFIGPEGHLITTEFSVNSAHCLKIFRYKNCDCHRNRPGSSKRPYSQEAYQVKNQPNS